MKFKTISKLLITTLFLSNINISSLASTWSDDGRSETFEGSNLTIDNIIEESSVDVSLEGNTLINRSYGEFDNAGSAISQRTEIENGIREDVTQTGSLVVYKEAVLKDNTTYTLICDVITNSSRLVFSFGKRDIYTEGSVTKTYTNMEGYKKEIVTLTTTTGCHKIVIGVHGKTLNPGNYISVKNMILLEGDWSNKEIPGYFEEIKSSFEGDSQINGANATIKSCGKNLINLEELDYTMYGSDTEYEVLGPNRIRIKKGSDNGYFVSTHYLKPNTTYTVSYKRENNVPESFIILENNEGKGFRGYRTITTLEDGVIHIFYRGAAINSSGEQIFYDVQLEESSEATSYSEYKLDSLNFYLNEPLREINGVKDKIIKKDGQWVVERNCDEVVLNGSEDWKKDGVGYFGIVAKGHKRYHAPLANKINSASDMNQIKDNSEKYIFCGYDYQFAISNPDVSSSSELKNWLRNNPIKVVYQLAEPTYESLKINPAIQLFEGTTYITNDSAIPTNMKVVIDRTSNKASEAIEVAKLSPTVENISIARMWTNLLNNSTLKDRLQSDISDITNISDLKLDKKSVSANIDMYIKPDNSISMSLDTNSITFENYTGLESMEKLGAVNITINSSLPYRLNAYMPVGLSNSDNSSSMDINLLNIRENTETNYSQFKNTTDKIVLKENCDKGNNKIHSIDLKLDGDQSHKSDIYKAVVKFEAEQK